MLSPPSAMRWALRVPREPGFPVGMNWILSRPTRSRTVTSPGPSHFLSQVLCIPRYSPRCLFACCKCTDRVLNASISTYRTDSVFCPQRKYLCICREGLVCYLLFILHDSISSVQLFQQLVDVIDPQGFYMPFLHSWEMLLFHMISLLPFLTQREENGRCWFQ